MSKMPSYTVNLTKLFFMAQPSGFIDASNPGHVCCLKKGLYGFKQAPHAWFQRFTSFMPSSRELLSPLISLMKSEFAMSDLGPLHYFLGISVSRNSKGLFLS